MQRTHVGVVFLVVSMLAVGPLQLWKAENRVKIAAQFGCTGPGQRWSRPPPFPLSTQRPSPSFTPGPPATAFPRLPEPQAVRSHPDPPTPWGTQPLTTRPHSESLLLDYAFHHTAVAVVQVIRFPWDVVLTAPHTVQVHGVADPETSTPAVAVPVLAVHVQGPYVAVWIPDPGVLLEPEATQRVYRLQLTIPPGAVSRAVDDRKLSGMTHAFLVSALHVAEDLEFLDLLTPGHVRVSGQKAEHPSGPEATRASLLINDSLDLDTPPTPLARIVARLAVHPTIPPGFFEDDARQGR